MHEVHTNAMPLKQKILVYRTISISCVYTLHLGIKIVFHSMKNTNLFSFSAFKEHKDASVVHLVL